MKTRTLLMLALACGLAILVAGGVLLLQLLNRTDVVPPTPVGEQVAVGDMRVSVVGADERDGVMTVELVLGGVDDPDAAEGFRLIASGRESERVDDAGPAGSCAATTLEAQPCTLAFDVSPADGVSRVLFYRRGDQQARWVLDTT
jgi:hypothetical protein